MASYRRQIQILIIFALVGALFLVGLTMRREAWEVPLEREQDGGETAESLAQADIESEKAAYLDLRKAQREGSVRVIVGLQVDFVPEGKLDQSQVEAQRDEIKTAQAELLADLQGTGALTLREYDSVPFIALELPTRALDVVRRSPRVSSLQEDRPEPAGPAGSAPAAQAPDTWTDGYTGNGHTITVLEGLLARENGQALGDEGGGE
jgi:hypothetical protein